MSDQATLNWSGYWKSKPIGVLMSLDQATMNVSGY